MKLFLGTFIILHGMVHVWYVVLSQGWVEFQENMGWTGESWLLSNVFGNNLTHGLASLFYSLSALTYIVAGAGLISGQSWSRPWMVIGSSISIFAILVFWDGNFRMPVEKGILGLIISLGVLLATLIFQWPKL